MAERIRHLLFLAVEKIIRWCLIPKTRAWFLRLLGANIGRNVRICECQFINLSLGFSNFTVEDDVYIGPGCLIDLHGKVKLARGATISPRVVIISHNNPGSFHDSPLVTHFPVEEREVYVGAYCWVGAGVTLLPGSLVGERTVVGAMALVNGRLDRSSVYVGIPARKIRTIEVTQ